MKSSIEILSPPLAAAGAGRRRRGWCSGWRSCRGRRLTRLVHARSPVLLGFCRLQFCPYWPVRNRDGLGPRPQRVTLQHAALAAGPPLRGRESEVRRRRRLADPTKNLGRRPRHDRAQQQRRHTHGFRHVEQHLTSDGPPAARHARAPRAAFPRCTRWQRRQSGTQRPRPSWRANTSMCRR